jgi:glyoxylase-like metal-dependent hydrolase (beta-lactamase superfamily II)
MTLQRVDEQYRGLTYPWGRLEHPGDEPFEVAPGVWWVRFTMPGPLNHINLWLLEDGDGWTIVDTCLNLDSAKAHWEALFDGFMESKPVHRVICTHMHPDHIGLAGWLCERFACHLHMTQAEFLTGSLIMGYTGEQAPPAATSFYHRTGFSDAQLENYRERFGSFGQFATPLPHNYQRLSDRQTLSIGGRYWQVVTGQGHSPDHACLYCPALQLVIAGDQILPRITPNVSVFPTEPDGNPLEAWLASSTRLLGMLPEDLLVLPAHQSPFTGVRVRLNQIIDSHRLALANLYDWLMEPKLLPECFGCLFGREIGDGEIQMATGETVAHLNYLLHRGNITRRVNADDRYEYQSDPEARYIDAE